MTNEMDKLNDLSSDKKVAVVDTRKKVKMGIIG